MYGRKSKYQRRYARKGRARVAKMARGKVSAIQALAKSVRSIQRKLRSHAEYLNYGQNTSFSVSADYYQYCLSNFAGWTDIFGTGANDDEANKMIHKSFGMDMYLSLENTINEPDTTTFTMFLVSLKDSIGASFNPATSLLTLNPNVHYVINNGQVLLNKKCFSIHKIKRCTLTNHGQSLSNPSAQSQYGTDWRGYWKIRPNTTITNPYGDWKSMSTALDPSKTYYLLIFNDNSAVDLQNPLMRLNVVHTVQTVA